MTRTVTADKARSEAGTQRVWKGTRGHWDSGEGRQERTEEMGMGQIEGTGKNRVVWERGT